MRTGEHLRLKAGAEDGSDLYLPVLIRPADGLVALGDDLHMRWGAAPRVLTDGGRIEIETHAGLRSAWLTPGLHPPVRLRLRDLGLPARRAHPTGHLFVTLFASEEAPSAAEDLLARFTRVWTPDRLAA
jgi:curved DNA-binding protein